MPRRNQVKEAQAAIEAAEAEEMRAAQAMRAYKLRLRGMSWWDIAEELELPEAQIKARYHEAIRAAGALVSEGSKRQLLDLEISRLDALMEAHWTRATSSWDTSDKEGNSITMPADVRAAEFVLKVIRERVDYLGLQDLTHGDISTRTVIIAGGVDQTDYLESLKKLAGPPTMRMVEGRVVRDDLDEILDAHEDDEVVADGA